MAFMTEIHPFATLLALTVALPLLLDQAEDHAYYLAFLMFTLLPVMSAFLYLVL